ncbi:MAG: CPBP family intramembrane metalloprotease [Chloroflexi bacterium]|nr:CPBP family intramembrane metalloprotease [Chloroflexota bacterium]
MNEPIEISAREQAIGGSWWDLFLYLFGGFGLFVAASLALAGRFERIDLRVTLAAILLNVLFIGGAPYVLGILRGRLDWAELGLRPLRWKPEYGLGIFLTTAVLLPVRAALALGVQLLAEGGMASVEARAALIFPDGLNLAGFLVAFLGVGVLAPLAEEFYFRGLLQGWFRQRLPALPAVTITALLFGLAHFDSPGVAASAFLLGLVMGWAYENTRSLAVPMGMHVLTNSVAILIGAAAMLLQNALGAP